MEKEIWRDIEGYEGLYAVSNLGRVKSMSRTICKPRNGSTENEFYCQLEGKIKEPQRIGPNRNYLAVSLYKDGIGTMFRVHKLVCKAFPEICGVWYEGCSIDHLDTNTFNNVATNLIVCTAKENVNNPLTLVKMKGHYNNSSSVKIRCIDTDIVYPSTMEVERQLGICHSNVSNVCKGKLKTIKGLRFEYVTP